MKYDKAVDFLRKIDGNVGIFFHDDTDGACSAALINSLLKQRGVRTTLATGPIDKESFKSFKWIKVDYIVFTDLAIDQYPDWLEMFDKEKIIIIDHHPIHNDLNKMGYLYVNSRLTEPDKYISASQICLDICKKAGLEGKEWIGKVGAVGDRALEGTPEEEKVAEIISANKSIRGPDSLIKIAKFMTTANSMDDIMYTTEYQKPLELMEGELERQITNFERNEIEDINFFEFRGNYSILSVLSSSLFDKYPNKTIIVYRINEGYIKISGRSPNHDLGTIFAKATEGIGNGGGHPKAAGAKIKEKDFEKFKKRVMELIRK
ncbi:MAG: DHH family phosphoesterase [Candidatus Aenigmarchaeota archaeon]|nr:DHH family phosphoesterase [Candidatus Aenigmarchaeota archaeon]